MAATEQLIDTLSEKLQPVRPLRKPLLRAALWSAFATLVITVVAMIGGSRADLAHAMSEAAFGELFKSAIDLKRCAQPIAP